MKEGKRGIKEGSDIVRRLRTRNIRNMMKKIKRWGLKGGDQITTGVKIIFMMISVFWF